MPTAPLYEEFHALQNERAEGWRRVNQLRGTPPPAPGLEPSDADAQELADLERQMTPDELRDWQGYTQAEKLYILRELRGGQ